MAASGPRQAASRPRVPISRRVFVRAAAGGATGTAAWSLLSARGPAASAAVGDTALQIAPAARTTGPAARIVPFGTGWLFGPAVAGSDQPAFDDGALATVTLPHTVAPLSWQDWDPSGWERIWVYRRHFDAPAGAGGMRVFLDSPRP
ncbi:MAG: hypothetical protein WAK82_22400 [Streptosporangiaceae bacterium]